MFKSVKENNFHSFRSGEKKRSESIHTTHEKLNIHGHVGKKVFMCTVAKHQQST